MRIPMSIHAIVLLAMGCFGYPVNSWLHAQGVPVSVLTFFSFLILGAYAWHVAKLITAATFPKK